MEGDDDRDGPTDIITQMIEECRILFGELAARQLAAKLGATARG